MDTSLAKMQQTNGLTAKTYGDNAGANRASRLGEIDQTLSITGQRLMGQIQRMSEMLDRLAGGANPGRPGSSDRSGTIDAPMPADLSSRLGVRTAALSELASALEHQIDRLEPITG